ncbi:MAG TPA: right-handed parallel beta-helix repeat-containing protein [Albidovulum sp.]|uniref:choice-of-anchor Q domain-containing protein n=1 Tax=Albidovulum sp. TaxID=1872424 RepID=UPI002B99D4DD|nr:right-handed parallel beta-helix repeat-containing protein [Albidovulum sp.]
MTFVKSLLMASVGLSILGSQVSAAEYFVQPLTPGPVANTAVAAISLQATAPDDVSAPSAEQNAVTQPPVIPPVAVTDAPATGTAQNGAETKEPHKIAVSPGAKWVSARGHGEASGTTGGTTTTTPTAPAPTTPVVTAPSQTGSTGTPPTPSTTTPTGPAPVMTASQTYNSLGALLQSGKVQGGDRIYLLGGYHGQMVLAGLQFTSPVTITSMPGQVAHVDSINVRASSKIVINGLKVWPTSAANGLVAQVRSYNDSSDLVFSDLDVRAAANSTNYQQWNTTDWNNNQRSGFLIDGQRQTVFRNRLTGVYNGVFVLGQNALVEENIVDGFAGDAFRALGDNSVVRRNRAQNCRQTTGTHIDGIQSFSRGPTGKIGTGVVRNIVIEGNKFLEFVGARSPINCKLQGIGLFDGMYDGFVIRNNLISSTAYHGITIGGGLNSVITNNTVVHAMGTTGNWPWLRVSNHKNGTPSQNVTVANNLLSSLKVTTNPALGILQTNNITVTNALGEFNSVANQDFTLKSTSTAIDKGAPTLAPPVDIAKSPRPKGKAPDAGAYESF